MTDSSNSGAGSQTTANHNIDENPNDDVVLLRQRYNEERFGDEIVGEGLNNGSKIGEYVKVSASFYDQSGAIIGQNLHMPNLLQSDRVIELFCLVHFK